MRRKHIIIGLAALCVVVAVAILRLFLQRPQMAAPAVAFVGYTNDSSGISRALFVITNATADAFDLLPHYSVDVGQPLHGTSSTTPLAASASRLFPGAAVTATVARPAQAGPWRATFMFIPTRPPLVFRVKRALHRAGARGMDMALPGVSASSDLIGL